MILAGIAMLVAGVLLGAYLIHLWTRPPRAPTVAAPEVVREVERRVEAVQDTFDRMNEVFDRMDFPVIGTRGRVSPDADDLERSWRWTVTTTTTTTPAQPAPPAPPPQPPAPPAPPPQPPVTLFDHLAKEDESPNQ